MQHGYRRAAVLFVLLATVFGASSSPAKTKDSDLEEIFKVSDTKRDASSAGSSLSPLKSALYNPYAYPPLFPGKPFFYPILTPADVLLNRWAKSAPTASDPSGEEASKRAVATSADGASPPLDGSFFLSKKYDFLDKLFKSLNATNATSTAAATADDTTATTVKPTIVPPSFWFPFPKVAKPTKAPKPTKPPKAKKVLSDAIEAMLLHSLLKDLGVDSTDMSKRAILPKKGKKVKGEEGEETLPDVRIPAKVDPSLYSSKASDCLDKVFKVLSKADDAGDLSTYVEPKATVVPASLWAEPNDKEYTSKLEAFVDLMVKSLKATEGSTKKPKKIAKRSATFLDELLHRIPPTPTAPAEPEPGCPCMRKPCTCAEDEASKKSRSLIFKPFGTGYWIPQYLYAAKMGLYLDKLMDTINTAAAEDATSDVAPMKRSVAAAELNVTGLSPKEAALTLLIAELVDVKNDIVEAFGDGVKAQKAAATTTKPYGGSTGKAFKKPFWGPKPTAAADPVEPIQKRIDILNDIFDKLTEVEKALIFDAVDEPKAPKDSLPTETKTWIPKFMSAKDKPAESIQQDLLQTKSPDYYTEKARDMLLTLYASKLDDNE